MSERTHVGSKMKQAGRLFLACLLILTLALGGGWLWADALYRAALDGRREPALAGNESVTSFDLLAQEAAHQTQSRISGWLSAITSEEIRIEGARGALCATQYDPLDQSAAAPWALVFHGGLGTERESVLDIACALSIHGYRVLTPDLYGHGASAGAASTLGYGDGQDVEAWIDYIEKTQMGAQIVLLGVDEGANAVLTAACDGLNMSVAAVAADSPSDDPQAYLRNLLADEGNGLERRLISAVYASRNDHSGERLSQRLGEVDIPLLLLHGTGDQLVPAWNSEDIAAANERAQLLLIEGAGHGMARHLGTQTYFETLYAFYEQALNENVKDTE